MALRKQDNLKATTGGLYESYSGSGGVTGSLRLSQGFDNRNHYTSQKGNLGGSQQFEVRGFTKQHSPVAVSTPLKEPKI